LSQLLAGSRLLILAQAEKIIRADFSGQTETFRTVAEPFAGHALAFVVIIADAEMLFKVFPRIRQVVLRLGRDHTSDTTRTVRAFCVSDTSSRA
jgi:hypothetical protein